MKKLTNSILLGLVIGLVFVAVMLLVMTPMLTLARYGYVSLFTENISVFDFVKNIGKDLFGKPIEFDGPTAFVVFMQCGLCLLVGLSMFITMANVLKSHLSGNDFAYFRRIYGFVYFVLYLLPEILIMLSIFFNFPLLVTLIVVACIVGLVFLFGFIITKKILPDLKEYDDNNSIYGKQ